MTLSPPQEDSSQEAEAPGVSQEEQVSGSQEEAGPSVSRQVPRPSGSTVSQVPPLQMRPPPARRRRMRELEEESLLVVREAAPLNPVESYASYLASELEGLGEEQRGLARDMIASVIQWARRDLLCRDTHLEGPARASSPPPPPPPAATLPPPARGRGRGRGRNAAGNRGGRAGRRARK